MAPGKKQQETVNVLHDDGKHVIARVSESEAEQLSIVRIRACAVK